MKKNTVYIYTYIYIYRERERARQRERYREREVNYYFFKLYIVIFRWGARCNALTANCLFRNYIFSAETPTDNASPENINFVFYI